MGSVLGSSECHNVQPCMGLSNHYLISKLHKEDTISEQIVLVYIVLL